MGPVKIVDSCAYFVVSRLDPPPHEAAQIASTVNELTTRLSAPESSIAYRKRATHVGSPVDGRPFPVTIARMKS